MSHLHFYSIFLNNHKHKNYVIFYTNAEGTSTRLLALLQLRGLLPWTPHLVIAHILCQTPLERQTWGALGCHENWFNEQFVLWRQAVLCYYIRGVWRPCRVVLLSRGSDHLCSLVQNCNTSICTCVATLLGPGSNGQIIIYVWKYRYLWRMQWLFYFFYMGTKMQHNVRHLYQQFGPWCINWKSILHNWQGFTRVLFRMDVLSALIQRGVFKCSSISPSVRSINYIIL